MGIAEVRRGKEALAEAGDRFRERRVAPKSPAMDFLCGPASSSCSSNLPESTAILAARGDDRREAQTKIMGAKRLTAFYIYMAAKR